MGVDDVSQPRVQAAGQIRSLPTHRLTGQIVLKLSSAVYSAFP